MLAEFQQALADLIASPEFCDQVRREPNILGDRYDLTEREANRLTFLARHQGMACNCMLYRANRLAPLALNLPQLVKALGRELRPLLDDFWRRHPNTDVHFYVESRRFCEYVQERMDAGQQFPTRVREALSREAASLAETLELSHTEIYSPLGRGL